MANTLESLPRPLAWPSDKVTQVPFNVFTDPGQYALEIERIFKGPVWHFLCLETELPEPGSYVTTRIGEIPIVATRDTDGSLHAFVNRCAHRGALLCLEPRGRLEHITCVYHSWSYSLRGELTGVAFQRGVKGSGGMPPDFRKEDHALRRLRVTTFAGLVFGSFADEVPPIEEYLGPEIAARIRRVLHKPVRVLGRNTQVLHNNWKLYFENTKDSYHASLLHLFFTTFKINRLNQKGAVVVDDSGGHHASYSMIDPATGNSDYSAQRLRSHSDVTLADPELLHGVEEFGDGVTLQILTVFPTLVLQQIQNALALRQVVPTGVGTTDLVWTYFGFEDDDEAMTELRLKQSNLAGPAGYVSMEDGAVGGFVQRGVAGADPDETGIILMGGDRAQSSASRATETSVRGFWKKYRTLMEGKVPDA